MQRHLILKGDNFCDFMLSVYGCQIHFKKGLLTLLLKREFFPLIVGPSEKGGKLERGRVTYPEIASSDPDNKG